MVIILKEVIYNSLQTTHKLKLVIVVNKALKSHHFSYPICTIFKLKVVPFINKDLKSHNCIFLIYTKLCVIFILKFWNLKFTLKNLNLLLQLLI